MYSVHVHISLTFIKFKKTTRENCDFVYLFSYFLAFTDQLNSKTIVHMRALHIPNDCSATRHLPFLAWGGV